MAKKLKISPPWGTYCSQLQALFGEDPDITIERSEDNHQIKLYVDNTRKATAIAKILPVEKKFGNVTLKITVIPGNDEEENKIQIFKDAFEDNPIVSYFKTIESFSLNYLVFKNKVVQFFNDNIADIYGNCSTLYEDIAREIFEDAGIFFCTDIEEEDE